MIVCEVCKKQPATVHLTEITPDARKETHICARCADKKGVNTGSASLPANFLGSLVSPEPAAEEGAPRGAACPKCGIHFGEFRAAGRLGCPNDYTAFRKRLLPFIERVHGAVQHTGKVPRRLREEGSARDERIARIRRDLKEAVDHEEFERAVQLRDELRAMGES